MILMTDLLAAKADAGGERFPVGEVFFDDATRRIHYVALRTGGFFRREEVLIHIQSFGAPDIAAARWPVSLDAAAVEAAPVWAERTDEALPVALEAWPAVVVGPFGSAESPLMLWSQAAALAGVGPQPDRATGDGRVDRLDRARRRIGAEAFGTDGALGHLADMIVETGPWRIDGLVILTERNRRHVPISRIRHFATDAPHVVLDLTRAELAALPEARPHG